MSETVFLSLLFPMIIFLVVVLINIFLKNAKDGVTERNIQVKNRLESIIGKRLAELNKKRDQSSIERAKLLNDFAELVNREVKA